MKHLSKTLLNCLGEMLHQYGEYLPVLEPYDVDWIFLSGADLHQFLALQWFEDRQG